MGSPQARRDGLLRSEVAASTPPSKWESPAPAAELPGNRRTRSWHSGAGRRSEILPTWGPVSASTFAHPGDSCLLTSSRVFGGIERRPRAIPPTPEQHAALASFSCEYQQRHHQRPRVVAFVNARSGGQTGGLIMRTLTESIGGEADPGVHFVGSVCDLSQPGEPHQTIEGLAAGLRKPSAETRLLVCGGDGTVTWILTALEQCRSLEGCLHQLPVAIVPLGTGNDLARSLGWGSRLRAVSDILPILRWVAQATPVALDQWRAVLRPHEALPADHKLREPGSHPQLVVDPHVRTQLLGSICEGLGDEPPSPRAAAVREVYVGSWQNYFSVGMDARVAGHVDEARSSTACGRCCFRRGGGKLCYAWQGVRHACSARLLARRLCSLRVEPDEPAGAGARACEDLQPPLQQRRINGGKGRLRQLALVNINSYGGGLNVLSESAGGARQSPNDGVLEVLAVRNAFTGLGLFARIALPTHLASARKVAFRLSAGEWMQLDGEPWQLDVGCDVLVEPHRRLTMLCAPPDASSWRGHVSRRFWAWDDAEPTRSLFAP